MSLKRFLKRPNLVIWSYFPQPQPGASTPDPLFDKILAQINRHHAQGQINFMLRSPRPRRPLWLWQPPWPRWCQWQQWQIQLQPLRPLQPRATSMTSSNLRGLVRPSQPRWHPWQQLGVLPTFGGFHLSRLLRSIFISFVVYVWSSTFSRSTEPSPWCQLGKSNTIDQAMMDFIWQYLVDRLKPFKIKLNVCFAGSHFQSTR